MANYRLYIDDKKTAFSFDNYYYGLKIIKELKNTNVICKKQKAKLKKEA